MTDPHDIDRALRRLPRQDAPLGFTRRVLDRVAESEAPRTRLRWALRPVAVALLVALVLGAMVLWQRDRRRRQQLLRQVTELRQEHHKLRQQLDQLRRQVSGAHRVVYVGKHNGTDFVLDLDNLTRPPDPGSSATPVLAAPPPDWTYGGSL